MVRAGVLPVSSRDLPRTEVVGIVAAIVQSAGSGTCRAKAECNEVSAPPEQHLLPLLGALIPCLSLRDAHVWVKASFMHSHIAQSRLLRVKTHPSGLFDIIYTSRS